MILDELSHMLIGCAGVFSSTSPPTHPTGGGRPSFVFFEFPAAGKPPLIVVTRIDGPDPSVVAPVGKNGRILH